MSTFLKRTIFPFIISLMVMGALVLPVRAATVSELQAMINQLLNQVAQLKLNDVQGEVNRRCPAISYNLKLSDTDASTGGQVTQLQTFLAATYNLNKADYVTGYFGRGTFALVNRFQSEIGRAHV